MGNPLYDEFRERLGQVIDLQSAIALLGWDQEVYMPPKGAGARGLQIATLSALAHRLFTAPEMAKLFEGLCDAAAPLEQDEAKLVAEARHDFEHAIRLPEDFVRKFSEEQSRAYHAWVKAREDSDFPAFLPYLETMVDLLRRKADYLGFEDSPYDALIDEYERGMRTATLRGIFAELAPRQSALVKQIMASPHQPDLAWLDRDWDENAQWALSLRVLDAMGYDFGAGRQDKSVHPFTTNFDLYDVRITTRLSPRDPFSSLMSSMHEGGHALYEQGFQAGDQRTLLAQAPSLGIHESQSRFWENIIGRSLPFWRYCLPLFREHFPGALDKVDAEQVFRSVNRVSPSLIRVEADECTYNLHIILRFEIELDLIEGRLRAKDIPGAWNAKMKEYLGVDVPDDAQGCLQDIHWAHGSMGYFPTYALGNLYAAELLETLQEELPALWESVEHGTFEPVLLWLREHIHRIGRRKTAAEIVQAATGRVPGPAAFLRYLESKYTRVYGLK